MFIPKQLPALHYQIDVPLMDLQDQVDRYARDQREMGFQFQTNPSFQRGHVWTEQQQMDFLEFYLQGGYSGILLFNHPRWRSNYAANMYLVDGLQRLTAYQRFLDGTLKPYGRSISEYDQSFLKSLYLKIGIASVTYREMLQWYVDMNSGSTPHTAAEIEKVKRMLDGA